MNKRTVFRIILYSIAFMMLLTVCTTGSSEQEESSIQDLETLITGGSVEKATVYSEPNKVVLTFKQIDGEPAVPPKDITYPEAYEEELIQKIKSADIPLVGSTENTSLFTVLLNFLPILLIIGVFIWFMRHAKKNGPGGMQSALGKAKAKVADKNAPRVTFKDVAGIDEAVEEVIEVKDYLVNNEKYRMMGAKIPRGILFVGPPGTGKSLLAKAVAGESEVPFFSMSASEFIEMFVGVGASRVRDLFAQAKANAPAIVFIDEIDSLGSRAGGMPGTGGSQEHNQTLNQLLVEMDGFDSGTNIIVIGATNRMDMMDPALLRAGRFDRKIIVNHPDKTGREAILNVHAKGKPLDEDIDLGLIAEQTYGFAGADLANLINEAAILAVRGGKHLISQEDLEEAINRSKIGLKSKRPMSEKDKRVTAFHEAGHTLTGYALKHSHPVNKVTIVSRGHAGGFTESLPEEESSYAEVEELRDRVVMMLGGRAAEKLLLEGRYTSGASNDISVATDTLHQMITQFGMDEELGPMRYGRSRQGNYLGQTHVSQDRDYSEDIQKKIDERKLHMLKISEEVAAKMIEFFTPALDALAEELLAKETLKRDEIQAVFEKHDVPKNGVTWEENNGNVEIHF